MVSDMSDLTNTGSANIDQTGFDNMDSNNSNVKKITPLKNKSTCEDNAEGPSSQRVGRLFKSKIFYILLVLTGLLISGGNYYLQVRSLDENVSTNIQGIPVVEDTYDVLTHEYHSMTAAMLLTNYPTREELHNELSRVRGADVSKEELSIFLLSVERNARDLAQLKSRRSSRVAFSEIQKAISGIQFLVENIINSSEEDRRQITRIQDDLNKLQKNSGWYHNRISKLERNPVKVVASKSSSASKARRVEMKVEPAWTVNGASENLAFIQNIFSGKRLRVTRGFDIPGCGQVIAINPQAQKVSTTSCIISN